MMNSKDFIKNYVAWGAAVAFAAFCLLYALPVLVHQGHITYFCYLPEFVRPFFDGLFSHTQASVSQGIVATNGMLSDTSMWADASLDRLQPRIAEFLWRFVSQFYLNKPLALLAATGITTLFLFSCRTISRGYTLLLLPLFFYFFTNPEPMHAAIAIALLLDIATLSFAKRLLHTKIHPIAFSCILFVITILCFVIGGKWALLFVVGAMMMLARGEKPFLAPCLIALVVASLLAWNIAYTPAFAYPNYVWAMVALFVTGLVLGILKRCEAYLLMPILGLALAMSFMNLQTPLERTLIKAQNAITSNNYARSLQLCERYYEKHPTTQDELQDEKTAVPRFALAACLKLSLLQQGQLCNRFLDYGAFYEMNLMYPTDFPFRYAGAWPYAKTYDVLEIYAPQIPFLYAYTERAGYQNRLMSPMLAAECGTQQYRLMQITERYVRRTLHGKMPACTSTNEDGARPIPLSSPELVRGGVSLDQWVWVYVARHKAVDSTLEGINRPLLDYYTLLTLLDKNLGALPDIVKAYAACGAPTLPVYVQEALCIWGLEHGENPQTILRRDYGGYYINIDNFERVDEVYRVRHLVGQERFSDLTRKYTTTYTYHYIFRKML